MKKLFYFLLIFCAGIFTSAVRSQSLQLLDWLGNDRSGAIIYVWGDSTNGSKIQFKLKVKNISSSSISIKSKKIETSQIPGTASNMCFAGQCYLSSVFTSPNAATIAPSAMDSSFIGEYSPKGHLGESIITFVFFDVDNRNDSVWIVAHFEAMSVGIAEINTPKTTISNPYPNPAVNYTSFDYSIAEGTSSAKFVLSDILGSRIKEEILINKSGTLVLNTSEIEGGIYFYSFYENDKLILTRKIIIKQ
jgi:hypothetical protein